MNGDLARRSTSRDTEGEMDLRIREALGSSLNSAQFDSLMNGAVNVSELDEYLSTIGRTEATVNSRVDMMPIGTLRSSSTCYTGNTPYSSELLSTVKREPVDESDAQRDNLGRLFPAAGTMMYAASVSSGIQHAHSTLSSMHTCSCAPLTARARPPHVHAAHCAMYHSDTQFHGTVAPPNNNQQRMEAVRPSMLPTTFTNTTLKAEPRHHHSAGCCDRPQIVQLDTPDATSVPHVHTLESTLFARNLVHDTKLGPFNRLLLPTQNASEKLTEPSSVSGEAIISRQSPTLTVADNESVTPSCAGSRRTVLEKGSDEYRLRRERNNVAVRKSREKAKARQEHTSRRVKDLTFENDQLLRKLESVLQELTLLKSLFQKLGAPIPESVLHTPLAAAASAVTSDSKNDDIAASLSALCAESASLLSDVLARRGESSISNNAVRLDASSPSSDRSGSEPTSSRTRRPRREQTRKPGQPNAASIPS